MDWFETDFYFMTVVNPPKPQLVGPSLQPLPIRLEQQILPPSSQVLLLALLPKPMQSNQFPVRCPLVTRMPGKRPLSHEPMFREITNTVNSRLTRVAAGVTQ